jgi:hypothetical protein
MYLVALRDIRGSKEKHPILIAMVRAQKTRSNYHLGHQIVKPTKNMS